jgi:membrane protein YqaA with SNARE-associated domain
MKNIVKLILIALLGMAVGAASGYWFGNRLGIKQGKALGRDELLAEQKKQQEDELAKIQDQANPFNDIEEAANPFKNVYQNPFGQ